MSTEITDRLHTFIDLDKAAPSIIEINMYKTNPNDEEWIKNLLMQLIRLEVRFEVDTTCVNTMRIRFIDVLREKRFKVNMFIIHELKNLKVCNAVVT